MSHKNHQLNDAELVQLVELIGGRENIHSVSHCITRLRLVLHQPKQANISAIESLSFVKGCFTQAGQFQVVIGTQVEQVYMALMNHLDSPINKEAKLKTDALDAMSFWEKLIANLAEIFVPLIPALIAGGLLLGLRNVLGEMPTLNEQPLTQAYPWLMPIYDFLWLPCEAIFHFLPVAICWSATKKMGGSQVLGIVLGVTLVSPQLMNAYLIGSQVPAVWDFGLFTLDKVGYQAQVIPSILAGLMLGYLEVKLKKIVPDYLYLVIVPVVSLLIVVILAHTLIGPIGRLLGDGVAEVVLWTMTGDYAPIGAALFGFFYSPLVITGIHHTTLAIDLQMIQSSLGGTPVWPIIALSNIAQASAVLAVFVMNKQSQTREIALPAAISAYLGVTEPAMYGINLRYRYPMFCAMVGAALAGLVCGLFGVLSNGIGIGGLPGILSIQPKFWGIYLFAMAIAISVPMILTMFCYRRDLIRANREAE